MKKYQNVRAHQISVTSGARALSSRLGVASIAMTGINVVATGQLKASDVLYSSMAAIQDLVPLLQVAFFLQILA